ncbi:ABC transporter substrate-binding protein [Rothia nasimurium]|uniref:ABC transporter substrate-binding protein n=1 Tax=Rothia nasimurium TaxID=85336 RepID=UPI001F29F38A|nr:ABC transporter substrate-binding protein [Rothia nasimurium]
MAPTSIPRRQALQLGAALTLGLSLTACSTSTPEEAASPTPLAPRTFTFAQAAHVLTLDPAQTTRIESYRISAQILDPLLKADANTGLPSPAIAAEWDVSDDGLTYTFTLDTPLSFSDGTALTAASVLANIDRWKKLGTGTPTRTNHPFTQLFAPLPSGGAPLIQDYTSPDDTTVTITLSRAAHSFLLMLTQPALALLAPGSIGEDGYLKGTPIGSGAFTVATHDTTTFTLIPNPHYRSAAPEITELTFVTIPDAEKRYYNLVEGLVDAYDQVGLTDYVPLALGGFPVQSRDPYAIAYLGINLNHPAFDDARVRRALAHAIDRNKIVSTYYPQGTAAARDFLPALFQIRNEDAAQAYTYNPEQARELLRASTYANQPIDIYYPINLSLPSLPSPEGIYSLISADLVKAGFTIVPKPYRWSDTGTEDIPTAHPDYGLELTGFVGAYRDPTAFLAPVISTAAKAPSSLTLPTATPSPTSSPSPTSAAQEPTQVASSYPAILQAIADADAITDLAERREAYKAINANIAELLPAIPLAYPVSGVSQGPRVDRYSVSATCIDDFSRVALES